MALTLVARHLNNHRSCSGLSRLSSPSSSIQWTLLRTGARPALLFASSKCCESQSVTRRYLTASVAHGSLSRCSAQSIATTHSALFSDESHGSNR